MASALECSAECYVCHSAYVHSGRVECVVCKCVFPTCGMHSLSERTCAQCGSGECTLVEDVKERTLARLRRTRASWVAAYLSAGSESYRKV